MKNIRTALIMATMALGVIMDGLDGSMVEVIVPTIASDFGASMGDASWIIIAYTMIVAAFLMPFTKVADSGNIRKVYVVGTLVFALGAFLGGCSTSLTMMIVARLIHGLGAAIIMSTAAMICVKFMPREHLTMALAVMVLGCAVGWSVGPAVGGFITEILSWHWVFYVNVPLALGAMLLGFHSLPKEESVPFRLDWPGIVFMVILTVCMLMTMEMFGDPETRWIAFVTGSVLVVSAIALYWFESRSPDPMINVRMLRNRSLLCALVAYFLLTMIFQGAFYLFPFYMQLELDLSVSMIGLIMLFPSVLTLFMCVPVGKICDKYGKKQFAIASCVLTLSYNVLLLMVTPPMGWVPILMIEVIMGIVWGLYGSSSGALLVDSAEEGDKGMASGMINYALYLGCAAGPALYATLMAFGSGMPGVSIDQLDPVSFLDGYMFSLAFSVAFSVLATVVTLCVRVRRT